MRLAPFALALPLLMMCEKHTPSDARPSAVAPVDAKQAPRIVFLGDSLTAGLGMGPERSYPALIQRLLAQNGYPHRVVNAGLSGDTSAGGLRRLDWALDGHVEILVVALGANDGLRGLSTEALRRNLTAIAQSAKQRSIAVLLAGMEAPPNYGPEYTAAFRQVFRDVADQTGVAFVPFLLKDVAGHAEFNQDDGLHPNARGAQIMAQTIWQALERLLSARRAQSR